jgi:hypothetical protein
MKKIVSALSVIVVLSVFVSAVVAQTGIPGSGWWTGEQVQNVGTATANIVVTAYDKNSTTTYGSSQSLAAGASFTFIPSDFAGMPTSFIGSAIVSSDQPIKAIVNVTNVYNGTFGVVGGASNAMYQGTESADTALYFPLVKNNRYGNSTAFYIQNAGSAAATAIAVFTMDTGGVYTYTTPSIGQSQMIVVNPGDAGVPSVGGTGGRNNIGSLKVTSAQPLAGTVLEYIQGQAVATVLYGTRGFTAADFNTKVYTPVTKNARYGRFTGIQVQNTTAAAIDVTITYVGSGGACAGQTYTDSATGIAAGASKTFVQLTGQTNLPANCTAPATVSATGNIVAIVNEGNQTGYSASGSTYSAMSDGLATTKISVPLFKDQRYDSSTGLQIENVGTATATNVVATFACKGASTFTAVSNPQTIVVGGAKLFLQPSSMASGTFATGSPFSSANVNCAVTITSDQKVVAIANTASDSGAFDDANYEGFNVTP